MPSLMLALLCLHCYACCRVRPFQQRFSCLVPCHGCALSHQDEACCRVPKGCAAWEAQLECDRPATTREQTAERQPQAWPSSRACGGDQRTLDAQTIQGSCGGRHAGAGSPKAMSTVSQVSNQNHEQATSASILAEVVRV